MKEYIIRLTPRACFETTLHSDTIFGAICWGIRMLFEESKLMGILEEFDKSPPFIISSAFPWQKVNEGYRYYLPKPNLRPLKIDELKKIAAVQHIKKEAVSYYSSKYDVIKTIEDYKEFRKIKWVPLSEFRRILKNLSEAAHFRRYLDKLFSEPQFWASGVVQKNSIDRLTNSTTGSGNTFYHPIVSFRENHGFYFLIRTNDATSYLKPVLRYLEDSGIGPNARTGRNWFSVEIEEKTLLPCDGGNAFVTLSRYMVNEPLFEDKCFYKLQSIRSKVESRLEFAGEDVWKEKVTYFNAGSVITPHEHKDFYGRMAEVKEIAGKTIRQYGYAYPVWGNMGGNNAI